VRDCTKFRPDRGAFSAKRMNSRFLPAGGAQARTRQPFHSEAAMERLQAGSYGPHDPQRQECHIRWRDVGRRDPDARGGDPAETGREAGIRRSRKAGVAERLDMVAPQEIEGAGAFGRRVKKSVIGKAANRGLAGRNGGAPLDEQARVARSGLSLFDNGLANCDSPAARRRL
jgi:hypothetical protein